ncbi:hypothetical protein [Glutamicibacter sp.]|uniref:hypothetical protein n=1 Tax=Glutamicibacter sp. TaxID=1931995 RepID=UPI0028BD4519|nr:hypothetical protein [Glutamicibacter sp.]
MRKVMKMSKNRGFLVLPVALTLMITGCSSANDQSAPSQPTQGQTQASSENLNAERVESVVKSVLGDDPSAMIVENEAMQQQLQMAKDVKASGGIKPEKCAQQMEDYTVSDLTGSVSATGTVTDEKLGKVVQVFSITDDDTLKKISHALTLKSIDGCKDVSVEQGGETLDATRQILPLDVKADQSLTMSTQLDAGGGQKLSSTVVQALKGRDFVIVTYQTGMEGPAELSAQAVELANKTFDEISASK